MSFPFGTEPPCSDPQGHEWARIKPHKEACGRCRVQRLVDPEWRTITWRTRRIQTVLAQQLGKPMRQVEALAFKVEDAIDGR